MEKSRGIVSRPTNLPFGLAQGGLSERPHPAAVPQIVHDVLRSPGQPLSPETRAYFEPRFGHDFGAVRVHVGSKATASAKELQARAYTVANHIVFRGEPKRFRDEKDRKLVGHELAHVVQQGIGGNTAIGTGAIRAWQDRFSEAVADQAAEKVANGEKVGPLSRISGSFGLLQRQQDQSAEKRYSITLTMPPAITQVGKDLTYDEALKFLRFFSRSLRGRIAAGREGHGYVAAIRKKHYVVGRISDIAGGVMLPPFAIWDIPTNLLNRADLFLTSGEINSAARFLQGASQSTHKCDRLIYEYREGTIAGAERAKFGLEVIEVAAAATLTVGTGGTAGVIVGAGYAGAQRLAGEVTSTKLGLKDSVDWAGIAFDTVSAAIFGKFGGRVGAALARRLGGKVTAKIATAVLIGRASGIAHATARELFDSVVLGRGKLTMEGFIERLAQQLTLKAAFMDLVSLAVGAGAERMKAGAPPDRSPSSPVAGRLPKGVTDINEARARLRPAPTRIQPVTRTAVRASAFDGAAARQLAEPKPLQEPLPEVLPETRLVPSNVPSAAQSATTTATTPAAYAAVGVAAAAGVTAGKGQKPLKVILRLPAEKAVHAGKYASLIWRRRLQHKRNVPRKTAQRDKWDRSFRPQGPMGINQIIWNKFEEMGVSPSRRLRPNWHRTADGVSMDVDHCVEWQLLGKEDRAVWGDTMSNYELLDHDSNGRAGTTLKENIRATRRELASATKDNSWLYKTIVFTDLEISGGSSSGLRWLPHEIQSGLHYFALRELLRKKALQKKHR